MKKRKHKMRSRIIISVLEILLIIVLVAYVKEKSKYENVFCKNTIINGQDCSLLTIEETERKLQSKHEQYVLQLTFKDNEVEYITGAEIGLKINNLNEFLNDIKERQRKDLFLSGGEYNFNNFSYSKEKLTEVLSTKKQLQPVYMEEKTRVKYQFNFNSKLFEIIEQNVYYLDFNQVFEEVSTAIEKSETSISLENLYKLPERNPTVLTVKELNQLLSSKITYQLPGEKEYTLDATILYTWLVQDEDGNYRKDDETWNRNIEDFVTKELGVMANTVGTSREFKPSEKDSIVLIKGGNYGYQLDKDVEIQILKEELENKAITKREPSYLKTESSIENNGLGNSYVEIDITRQKVWVYVDGNLELETDCVTGCVNEGHSTPTGIFTLTYKERDRILRGKILPNGKREYESPVSYWMPFNGGIGLHDATWRKSFGGNIYISNGSHGCINLPFEAAKELYDIINEDMPIIVYES